LRVAHAFNTVLPNLTETHRFDFIFTLILPDRRLAFRASPSIDVATFRLGRRKKVPLGWVLSSITKKEIADQLNSESNAPAVARQSFI